MEISDSHVKVVEAKIAKGKREITRIALSESINQIIISHDVTNHNIRINIPRHLATVRFLKLPSTDEEEIKNMIKIEAVKQVPYGDEEVISGCRIIEKFNDGYSNVLLAIIQGNVVKRFLDILKGLKIESVESLSLSSEALFLWYLVAGKHIEEKNVLLVDIDSDHIDIDVLEDNRLVFTRGVSHDKDLASTSETIVDQIRISIAAYQKESDKTIDKIVISGVRDRVNECRDLVIKESKVPVEILDQMTNIPITANVVIEQKAASFVELLGLTLRPQDAKINLMPEELQAERRFKLLQGNAIKMLILTGFIIMVSSGLLIKKIYDKSIYVSNINLELKKISPQITKAKKMLKDINLVEEEIDKKPLAIDIIREVYKITPSNITFTMLNFETQKTLIIRGNASNLANIFKYISALEDSSYFENVKVKYANKRIMANKETADFEIECHISKIIR